MSYIKVLWSGPGTANMTITGPGAVKNSGSTVTMPDAITASKQYDIATSGQYTMTTTWNGTQLDSRVVTLEGERHGTVIDLSPNATQQLTAALPTTSTTAALAAVANAINTGGKFAGKMVFNTTTGKPVWAVGPLAADVWKDATGATAHTPI